MIRERTALLAPPRPPSTLRPSTQVGQAWKSSGVPRSELFLATKISSGESHGYAEAKALVARQLKDLETDYIDLCVRTRHSNYSSCVLAHSLVRGFGAEGLFLLKCCLYTGVRWGNLVSVGGGAQLTDQTALANLRPLAVTLSLRIHHLPGVIMCVSVSESVACMCVSLCVSVCLCVCVSVCVCVCVPIAT